MTENGKGPDYGPSVMKPPADELTSAQTPQRVAELLRKLPPQARSIVVIRAAVARLRGRMRDMAMSACDDQQGYAVSGRQSLNSGEDPMPHLVLIGDSIFDNAAYVPNDPPVIIRSGCC